MPRAPLSAGYYDEDIIGFGSAMKDAGITVSWSPGVSVTPANGTFIARHGYGASYRVSEDMWDLYDSADDGTFPTGIRQKLRLSGAPRVSHSFQARLRAVPSCVCAHNSCAAQRNTLTSSASTTASRIGTCCRWER